MDIPGVQPGSAAASFPHLMQSSATGSFLERSAPDCWKTPAIPNV